MTINYFGNVQIRRTLAHHNINTFICIKSLYFIFNQNIVVSCLNTAGRIQKRNAANSLKQEPRVELITKTFLLKCPQAAKIRDFLIIGHAGGDSYKECENTLEATEAALQRSPQQVSENIYSTPIIFNATVSLPHVNAIEIDLSMSKDNVIFLWHDPDPRAFTAAIRRYKFY